MDQTRFDVLQSTFQVVSNLFLQSAQHHIQGRQFLMTLIVKTAHSDPKPLDIYVDRVTGSRAELITQSVDGAKRIAATASVDPDGERFDLEITLERVRVPKNGRPEVRVSREMFRLLRGAHNHENRETVSVLLESLGLE